MPSALLLSPPIGTTTRVSWLRAIALAVGGTLPKCILLAGSKPESVCGMNDAQVMETRGHPKLRMRHITFKIGIAERGRWLELMTATMVESGVPHAAREFLDPFFAQVADFMRNQADR